MAKDQVVDSDAAILDDIGADMRKLRGEVRAGAIDLRIADSLANIAGKELKVQQIKLARQAFGHEQQKLLPPA